MQYLLSKVLTSQRLKFYIRVVLRLSPEPWPPSCNQRGNHSYFRYVICEMRIDSRCVSTQCLFYNIYK